MDAITAFAEHVAARGYNDLPAAAVAAAKTFLLDTLGVGLIGSSGPKARELVGIQPLWGSGSDARVWSTGERLPAPAAAFCNAYQVHNAEFDCVHEAAVAHVMTIVLPVALAGAERMAKIEGKPVDGRRLIEAVVLGVDVAASLGLAATSGLRFFRPATVGVFGGSAALGKLMGFDARRLQHAFAIAYGQLSGNMQAHTEGSLLLAMQMGFSARNAVVACDLARAGFEGPANILEGPFGYFKLIEPGGDPARVTGSFGKVWRITEVAHKPFPSGRATHGIVDACLELRRTARLRRVRHRGGQSLRAAARASSRGPSAQEPDADQLRAAVCFICRRPCLPARDGRVPRLQRCRLRRSRHAGPRPPHRPGGARRRRSQRARASRGGGDARNAAPATPPASKPSTATRPSP